ncbi:TPA: hypothetical protein RUZ23_003376 [Vibrio cholerae]|uniref:hypothetical protein n=1 Tax=Vibrio TaxID=662 RepID=UPI000B8EDEFC|nr:MULTISPECIES: hypothetical protein [Vibrio]EGR0491517.1 hypothetical protein [Vibrio cholerae]EGR1133830.1 hypothetical protein [Vibrio cholerae]EGR3979036.1 hypothetical protein [Vibrio cholerae]ELN3183607.1 hypothetical protein [Vibrio cholerae]MBP0924190.1 hypothetical protein [Vibrio cholerae]
MEKGIVSIHLDERWSLEDFSVFSKQYIQIYGFFYGLRLVQETDYNLEFDTMPWLGGGSVMNFFLAMKNHVHPELLPNVHRIQYASPGVMELSAIVEVAGDIKDLILTICASLTSISTTYYVIHKQYVARKMTQKKMAQLDNEMDKKFVRDSVFELHEKLNLSPSQIISLAKITKGDELIELKVLMAMYRRAKPIADLQVQNKAQL